ncbi:metal-dependent hydrolase [Methanoregula sp.]|uniref:metal-dependent hydrolase n=1 Tax=Methanoregula sp. TaxID=2052170 RepID=UPI003C73B329
MITRHHLSLTLLCMLILCCAFFQGNLIWLGFVIIGAEMGAILPDIQMKKPSRFRSLTFAYYITRLTTRLYVPVMIAVYGSLEEKSFDPKDKRLTHSLPGITFIFLGFTAILTIPDILSGSTAIDLLIEIFLAGLALGLLLHLVLDLCTRKGISPFFPFSTYHIRGSIRPCDDGDRRILYFHFTCILVLAGMIALVIHEPASSDLIRPVGLLGSVLCTGTMILFSRRDGPGDARYTRRGMEEGAGPLTPPFP